MFFYPKNQKAGLSLTAALILGACSANLNAPSGTQSAIPQADTQSAISQATFSQERIRADVEFIADDLMRGRETGSEGHRISAKYLATTFKQLGIAPAGDDGSYLQEVPMRTASVDREKSSMSITVDGVQQQLSMGDDFYMSGSVRNGSGTASGELVFVGFGVHAPDMGHDDLKGVDLDGKIAVMLTGAPKTFNTEIRAHHGSTTTKYQTLAQRGAAGVIIILNADDIKRRPFESYKRFIGNKSYDWLAPDNADLGPQIKAGAVVSNDVAKKLFAGASKSYDEVIADSAEGISSSFALKARATVTRESHQNPDFKSPNVLAMLEGSDPTLRSEVVVVTAHLDHIGVHADEKRSDRINNGAIDNASGIAVMMEVARTFAETGIRPRRSVLFAAVTGEERGLLGSEYLAMFPTIEKSRMVANVNLDMPVLLYNFTDVVAFGANRSSLGPIAAEAVASAGVTLSPDPIPQEGIFTRSDHYRFVQQGIPSIFLMTGFGDTPDGKKGGEVFLQFLRHTYHTPDDEIDQEINYEAASKFAYVNWLILNSVANSDTRPTWNAGDFFGRTFNGPMSNK